MMSLDAPDFAVPGFTGINVDADESRSENQDSPQSQGEEGDASRAKRARGRPTKGDGSVNLSVCRWDGCGKGFETANVARNHERDHSGDHDESYLCKMKIAVSSVVRGEPEFQVCGKSFATARQLRKHMVLHQPRLLQCDACGAAFHDMGKLLRHKKLHSGERPFSCDACGKEFGLRANLKTHMRIHSGERPYKCSFPDCPKSFAQACNRKTHEQNFHRKGATIDPGGDFTLPPGASAGSPSSAALGFPNSGTAAGSSLQGYAASQTSMGKQAFLWPMLTTQAQPAGSFLSSWPLSSATPAASAVNQAPPYAPSDWPWNFDTPQLPVVAQQPIQHLLARGSVDDGPVGFERESKHEERRRKGTPVTEDASLLLYLQQNRQQ